MDIRGYFNKVREAEKLIDGTMAVIVSLDTPEGGKAGRSMEVGRSVAAHMMVDARARLATDQEIADYRASVEQDIEQARKALHASNISLTMMTDENMKNLRTILLKSKG